MHSVPSAATRTEPVEAPAASIEPVFDAGVLGDMFNNEAALIAAVLRTFATSTQSCISDIEASLAAHDLTAVGLLAHRVKGASRMSGALALGHAAEVLELAAQTGSLPAVRDAVERLAVQWQSVQTVLGSAG